MFSDKNNKKFSDRRMWLVASCVFVSAFTTAYVTRASASVTAYLKVRLNTQTAPAFTCVTERECENTGTSTCRVTITYTAPSGPTTGTFNVRPVDCPLSTYAHTNPTPVNITRADVAQVYTN